MRFLKKSLREYRNSSFMMFCLMKPLISHTSQLSLILRYVSGEGENMEVHEDFIELIEPFADIDNNTKTNDDTYLSDDDDVLEHGQEQGTGKDHDLPVTEEEIKLSGMNLEKCAGIGTDGCSVMLSEVVGTVFEIQKEAINAVRTPCFNHKLNLSIAQSNKVVCIRNAVGTMKECITFFDASSKRQRVLKLKLGHGLSGIRHDGVLQFSLDLPKMLEALQTISTWADSAASSKANSLRNSMTDSFFLVSVLCLSDILSLTSPLSKILQKKNLSLDEASSMIVNLLSVVSQRRSDAEQHFGDIWNKAEAIAESIDTELKAPRRCRNEVLDCFHLPFLLPAHISGKSSSVLKEKSELSAAKFQNILPIDDLQLSERLLLGELSMWHAKWRSASSAALPSLDALKACDAEVYPLFHTRLTFLTTLPVSNATAERSFPVLRRLKLWLRTTMKQGRLNGLALLLIHRAELSYPCLDKIIDRFAKKGKRLIDFTLQ
ncbi:52 kDa repressor of the inhibitor of the protein kinase [Frankliniella fusca]|uniref:52 kDa repressor of the inhibitor of the protein kinase n=1 Tax=Frankliniella fusca TaxID=407009 RepID=A0AAE1GU71_9NEOP|nr:52 kDa repressor of the inhibitor of the protein kinase [Frankliniella fusca]